MTPDMPAMDEKGLEEAKAAYEETLHNDNLGDAEHVVRSYLAATARDGEVVTRWKLAACHDTGGETWIDRTVDPEGDYVTFEDHKAALRASLKAVPEAEVVKAPYGDMIYIASKTKHADRWRKIASIYPVSSSWIYEAGEGETADFDDLWHRCLTEAAGSKALVIYREPDEVMKGAWIELGAAQAHGVPVHAVGIEEFTVSKYRGITHHRTMKEAISAALREPSRSCLATAIAKAEGRL